MVPGYEESQQCRNVRIPFQKSGKVVFIGFYIACTNQNIRIRRNLNFFVLPMFVRKCEDIKTFISNHHIGSAILFFNRYSFPELPWL